jgi:hypothetical protein
MALYRDVLLSAPSVLAARWARAAELAATAARRSCWKAASSIFSPFAQVDRTPRVPFQAGIEELLRVFDGGSAGKGELHDLLVRFPCADDAVMWPDGDPGGFWLLPLPLLLDVGVGVVDEPTDMSEGLSPPIPQLFNPLGDVRWSGLAIRTTRV